MIIQLGWYKNCSFLKKRFTKMFSTKIRILFKKGFNVCHMILNTTNLIFF